MDPESLGPLFVHPSSPNRLYLITLCFSSLTIVVALIALIRGRVPLVIRSAALLLIPIFAYVLGNLQILEDSKRVEFCGSCHETMSPVVKAMRTDGTTLAAIHYQQGAVSWEEACYECHSGYGIWGTVDAKMAGVKHMLHTVTGDFEFPLTHHGPFDIDSCLNCHAEAQPFRDVELHRDADIQKALVDREMGCTGACHPSAHPPDALNGADAS